MSAQGVIQKHVGETLHIGFRYRSPALSSGETLTSVSVSPPSGITAGSASIAPSGVEVWAPVSGGTAGVDYTIRFTVQSSAGQTFVDDYLVKVVA